MRLRSHPLDRRRVLLIAAVVMATGFAAAEVAARLLKPWPYRVDVYDMSGEPTTKNLAHPVLGYAPLPDRQFVTRGYYEDRQVFEAAYSIDGNGLRVSSPDPTIDAEQCILFFGGSTSFGEAVADRETVPYLLAEKTLGRYKIYNFGYFYYGGHQMLAAVESDLLDEIIDCEPRYAVYFGYVAHAERATHAGEPYSQRVPTYTLDDGVAVLDHRAHLVTKLLEPFAWSRVVRKLETMVAASLDNDDLSRGDLDLYIAIVEKARRLLEARYPDLEFHVIFWDERANEDSDYIVAGLLEREVRMHFISEIFPHYDYQKMRYSLGPRYMLSNATWHLNGQAYVAIAQYIAANIVK
jgi:hypothetical protein